MRGSASASGLLSEQLREIVEAHREIRMIRPKARLEIESAQAHVRLGLIETAHGLKHQCEIVEPSRHFVDDFTPRLASKITSARRMSGSASARRFVGSEQLGEVVEVPRHIGVILPVARLVDRQRVAISGSASAMRFVALSSCARVLRHSPRRGGPAHSSSPLSRAPGASRLGLGDAVRVHKQKREIVEAARHIGMIRAVAPLVGRKRASHQQLGLGDAVRGHKQPREIVEAGRHTGMIRAVAISSIARARRMSSSASARRFVA